MDYLEVIRLRTAAGASEEAIQRVAESVLEAEEPGLVSSGFYRGKRFQSDLAIHLHYQLEGDCDPCGGLGIRVAAALEEYGLVDRALWFRVDRNKNKGEG